MIEEIIDLVDEQGTIIATLPRSEVFKKGLKNFRLVCIVIKNHEGKFYIPRRAPTKKEYPNALACFGGCVQSGESYDQACKRELLEETVDLDFNKLHYRLLGFISPFTHPVNGYVAAYEVTVPNHHFSYNPDDFSEGSWMSLSEFYALLEQGDIATKNLKAIFELFYKNGSKN